PGPGFVALILLECLERDDQHALRSTRPETRIDVVERTRGGRDAERCAHPAWEAIEIFVGAERLSPVRGTPLPGRMKVDDVEIGGVGQRMAAEPPKAGDD